jgi:hypothetical protein
MLNKIVERINQRKKGVSTEEVKDALREYNDSIKKEENRGKKNSRQNSNSTSRPTTDKVST